IVNPHRLYVSDSTETGILKYDTEVKECRNCLVDSYDVGFMSVRRPGETWDAVEDRVKATRARRFTGGPHPMSRSTADLDPDARRCRRGRVQAARDCFVSFAIAAGVLHVARGESNAHADVAAFVRACARHRRRRRRPRAQGNQGGLDRFPCLGVALSRAQWRA